LRNGEHGVRVIAQIGHEGRQVLLGLLERLAAMPSAWPVK